MKNGSSTIQNKLQVTKNKIFKTQWTKNIFNPKIY